MTLETRLDALERRHGSGVSLLVLRDDRETPTVYRGSDGRVYTEMELEALGDAVCIIVERVVGSGGEVLDGE